ncbi:hypothetical protein [Mycobacteroides immunogenum]|nr:hypothetical protein [Mycobacteroides immunogenum]
MSPQPGCETRATRGDGLRIDYLDIAQNRFALLDGTAELTSREAP